MNRTFSKPEEMSVSPEKTSPILESRLSILRDLGNQLQIKAEKMRLLMRAEEGLGDVDVALNSPPKITPEKLQLPSDRTL